MTANQHYLPTVGIDDMAAYIPRLVLPISTLAEARELEYAKLNKGLGLEAMAVPDAHEDVATMAANAVLDLVVKNDLDPRKIGRLYVGTESALDGAKPMASYVLDMLTQYFSTTHGSDCLLHCDVVDLTFACIGAVDAMQNTLDWARGHKDRMGIVVSSDHAKYELGSGGEYTQGAGAVAMLIKQQPRLLAFKEEFGVATRSVHDFFKPLRKVSKAALVEEVLALSGQSASAEEVLAKLGNSLQEKGVLDSQDHLITLHKDTPIFDGPYSNSCYRNRIREALSHFVSVNHLESDVPVIDDWHRLVFHLPYAYQARRMFSEIFMQESQARGDWEGLASELPAAPRADDFEDEVAHQKAYEKFLRSITKTEAYRRFVADKIAPGERGSSLVGNLYTGSLLLSLMNTLEAGLSGDVKLAGQTFGCFAYGSGSKSKVFTAVVQPDWRTLAERFSILPTLAQRTEIDYATYEDLHRQKRMKSVQAPAGEFYLAEVCQDAGVQQGARTYGWQAQVVESVEG